MKRTNRTYQPATMQERSKSSSHKLQAPSLKLRAAPNFRARQAASDKQQAPSIKAQASSRERRGPQSVAPHKVSGR